MVLLEACTGSSSTPANPPPQFISGTALQAANTVVQKINQLQNGSGGLTPFVNLFDSSGVRFSADYYIENSDLVLTASAFSSDYSLQNPPIKVWGIYDGRGDPISMHIRDYFNRFVWNFPYHNYSANNATVQIINSDNDFKSQGNLINNMLSFYPLSSQFRIVEYHQSGINPSNAGMDWTSLLVVLKNQGNSQWTLVGLAHGAWTI